jgi:predicted YcjX-like family ATPase
MNPTSLTHAQAQAKINQVDEAMNHARQLVKSMQDRTQQMTSSTWLGNQSSLFATRMQQHTDDFTAVITRMDQIAETGKSNMMALVNLDSE